MSLRVILVTAVLCGVAAALHCLQCQNIESSECQDGVAHDTIFCPGIRFSSACVTYWINNNGINNVVRGCGYHKMGDDVCDILKHEKGAFNCTSCDSENLCNSNKL